MRGESSAQRDLLASLGWEGILLRREPLSLPGCVKVLIRPAHRGAVPRRHLSRFTVGQFSASLRMCPFSRFTVGLELGPPVRHPFHCWAEKERGGRYPALSPLWYWWPYYPAVYGPVHAPGWSMLNIRSCWESVLAPLVGRVHPVNVLGSDRWKAVGESLSACSWS